MKQKQNNQATTSNEHPYDGLSWHTLTDVQKAQLLLNTTRLLDSEKFREEFKSFEEPAFPSPLLIHEEPEIGKIYRTTSSRHIKIDELMLEAIIKLKSKNNLL